MYPIYEKKMPSLQTKLQQIKKQIGTDVIFIVGMRQNGKVDILQARSCKRDNNVIEEPEIEEVDVVPPDMLKEKLKLTKKTITYIG